MVKLQIYMRALLVAILVSLFVVSPSYVNAQASSTNYKVEETFFGSGGELEACSTAYCSRQSAGELTVGNTASPNYQAQAGFNTTDTPMLEFIVTAGDIDLGVLSVGATATVSGAFSVRSYLSEGYVVTAVGLPPTSEGGATINPMASQAASSAGTEQFGMNLVANTSPVTFGADPVQIPDSTFSFGAVTSNYGTPNQFRYAQGDIVAQSTKSTGQTNYTVSYITNIASVTESGRYTTDQVFVVTATF